MDDGEEEGVIDDHGVIYRDRRGCTSAIHAADLAQLRVCLHGRGWGSSIIGSVVEPRSADQIRLSRKALVRLYDYLSRPHLPGNSHREMKCRPGTLQLGLCTSSGLGVCTGVHSPIPTSDVVQILCERLV